MEVRDQAQIRMEIKIVLVANTQNNNPTPGRNAEQVSVVVSKNLLEQTQPIPMVEQVLLPG